MTLQPGSLAARDLDSMLHPQTHLAQHQKSGPMMLKHAEGVYMYDDQGNYIGPSYTEGEYSSEGQEAWEEYYAATGEEPPAEGEEGVVYEEVAEGTEPQA